MRDRLIEIVDKAKEEYANDVTDHTETEYIVESLLNNGVVVMPCKVGDTVYVLDDFVWSCDCEECEHYEEGWYDSPSKCGKTRSCRKAPECIEIVEITVTYKDILQYMNWGDFGKTIFLSREEAEAKLQEGKG